ncbi:MAG: hypothetical protein ABMB14_05010 [Myxococcota bacterium]
MDGLPLRSWVEWKAQSACGLRLDGLRPELASGLRGPELAVVYVSSATAPACRTLAGPLLRYRRALPRWVDVDAWTDPDSVLQLGVMEVPSVVLVRDGVVVEVVSKDRILTRLSQLRAAAHRDATALRSRSPLRSPAVARAPGR